MPDILAARPVAGQPIETAWGQQVHDAIEAQTIVPGQAVVQGGAATNDVTVLYPAFASVPRAVAMVLPDDGMVYAVVAISVQVDAAIFRVSRVDSTVFPAAVALDYIIIGALA
jgi:hypothetical protein